MAKAHSNIFYVKIISSVSALIFLNSKRKNGESFDMNIMNFESKANIATT